MKKPPPEYESKSLGEPAIIVAKYGRTTGLTTSVAKEVVSVTRQPISDTYIKSDDWCTIGPKSKKDDRGVPFSRSGDPGACIWDVEARIGGMLAAGSENMSGRAFDTTYGAPIFSCLQ